MVRHAAVAQVDAKVRTGPRYGRDRGPQVPKVLRRRRVLVGPPDQVYRNAEERESNANTMMATCGVPKPGVHPGEGPKEQPFGGHGKEHLGLTSIVPSSAPKVETITIAATAPAPAPAPSTRTMVSDATRGEVRSESNGST